MNKYLKGSLFKSCRISLSNSLYAFLIAKLFYTCLGEIAGYITTVENSVAPNSNPYAMVVPQPIQQACISRCKVAKVPNNHNCFTKCKDKPFSTHNGAKKLMNMKMIAPKPVINEKSCAKCRIPQPAGRSKLYSAILFSGPSQFLLSKR